MATELDLAPAALTLPLLSPDPKSRNHVQRKSSPKTRWRPLLHVMPPTGWLNDPCGPGYDPVNHVYHLGFQWNPKDSEWGDICWGVALSRDLLSWEICETPSIQPEAEYDCSGVFTGCMIPTAIDSAVDGTLTAIYTSVSSLPIHYTLPYSRGSEALALATSLNSGRSWIRHVSNPIITEPPSNLDVIGWRDPYIATWPAVDALLKHTHCGPSLAGEPTRPAPALYGILSGGIRGQTPTLFLYQIDSAALDKWRYLGTLISLGLNFAPSPRWMGDFGVNWEVCNFFTLIHPAIKGSRDFLICSVEGRRASVEDIQARGEFCATHAQMWMCGQLGATNGTGEVRLAYRYGGILDHGAFYAGNSFWDPQTQQRVIYGWVIEDDLSAKLRREQGWAGMIALPRVVKIAVLEAVVGALVSPLRSIGSVELIPEEETGSMFTVVTLCSVPDPRMQNLRGEKMVLSEDQCKRYHCSFDFYSTCAQWEMRLSIAVEDDASRVGFDILHSTDEKTTVYFDPMAELIVIDRTESSIMPGIRRCSASAPHTLFKFAGSGEAYNDTSSGNVRREVLDFHAFYDNSVLEIFVNERTALTTRVYPTSGTSTAVCPFINARRGLSGAKSRYVDGKLWPLSLKNRRDTP